MAERQNAGPYRLGEDWEMDFNIADGDGNPITNVAAAEYRIADKTTLKLKLTLSAGVEVKTPGVLSVIVGAASQTFPPGTYDHELWVRDGDTSRDSFQTVGTITVMNSLKNQYP